MAIKPNACLQSKLLKSSFMFSLIALLCENIYSLKLAPHLMVNGFFKCLFKRFSTFWTKGFLTTVKFWNFCFHISLLTLLENFVPDKLFFVILKQQCYILNPAKFSCISSYSIWCYKCKYNSMIQYDCFVRV